MGVIVMNIPLNSSYFKIATRLFVLIVIAKLLSLIVWFFLPSDGVFVEAKESSRFTYRNFECSNIIADTKRLQKNKTLTQKSFADINTIILQGLFGNSKSGYVIVAKKEKPSATSVIAIGEEFAGYKLHAIAQEYAIFTKNTKEYRLDMPKRKALQGSVVSFGKKGDITEHVQGGDSQQITKRDIKHYMKNPDRLWKEIAINEVRKDGKIQGFRIDRLQKDSKLAQIGLKKGDIILQVNGRELNSYSAVMALYNQITKLTRLEMVISRDNTEREIVYEIR
ncbi:MAG TPA: hypothetical protein EYH11_01115 [Sulfurimonas autotrophica]|nr:hypothetical protein [Sulfurimonas autotrophica]